MKVNCDICKKDFEVEQQIERVKDDIRRVYFICPHCNKKYIAYYLTNKIENKQAKANKLIKKMKKYYLQTEEHTKYFNQYQELTKEIKNEMQRLKEIFKES